MLWEGHTVVLGRTGSGKTYFVDNILMQKYKGKSVFYWLGGHDDVKLQTPFINVTGFHPVTVIEKLIESKKVVICYTPALEQLKAREELKFWQEKLMSKQRNCVVILDEAQRYAPQGSIDTGAHLLATGARKWGISCVFVCQRVAELSKTIASQCKNWVIFEHSIFDEHYLRERGILITDDELKLLSKQKYYYVKKEV